LIDEAMAHAAGAAGQRCVSADVRVRFRRPLPLGEPLTIEGRVDWRRRNVLGVSASVSDALGRLLISGTGSMVSHGDIEPGRLGAGTGS
jgi:acyl-coenzyme A thioesterase PaaI-like protein